MSFFLVDLYSTQDLKNFPTTDFFPVWQKILSSSTDIKYEMIWYHIPAFWTNQENLLMKYTKISSLYLEKPQIFPHQIGAVNPLSFMNCKLKEAKINNFAEY